MSSRGRGDCEGGHRGGGGHGGGSRGYSGGNGDHGRGGGSSGHRGGGGGAYRSSSGNGTANRVNGGHRGGGNGNSSHGAVKALEHKTMKQSYSLIDKYVPQERGIGQRYSEEYKRASDRSDRRLDFNKVVTNRGGNGQGVGYTGTVKHRAEALRIAERNSRGADKQAFANVHANERKVAQARSNELKYSNTMGGWIQWGTLGLLKTDSTYNNHKYAADSWK